jgi:hypothetical protein
MAPEDSSPAPARPEQTTPDATEYVAEAHRMLSNLRQQDIKHPDLDAAIGRLELALSLLTTRTGGML